MDVNQWFENGCDYKQGVMLYGSLKSHSSNLLRLFMRKENRNNVEKLKYELGKLRFASKSKIVTPAVKAQQRGLTIANIKATTSKIIDPGNYTEKRLTAGFYKLNQLHIDLHPLAIKQRNDFQTAISLHHKLTRLHKDEEGAALKLCIQIEDLFDAIETAQKVLDHYVTHKVVLNIEPRSYKDYNGAQLADARRNKRTSVTKYKNKVHNLTKQLGQNLSKTDITKTEVALERAENKLLQHEIELQQLNDLINGR